eukprot:TRINITY_DN3879_c0_g1_i4.p1 TRINITY_DN3879_c0_g1~~TRINITY_DN3879_c0_g1_i4.p1  ORF type:complete len:629 (+),score=102.36 TRINITY_DN3879_c0_g1_i4:62-1948(+)
MRVSPHAASDSLLRQCANILDTSLETLQREFRDRTVLSSHRSPSSVNIRDDANDGAENITQEIMTEYDFVAYRTMSSNILFCFQQPKLAFQLMDPEGTGKVTKANFCKYAPEMPPLCDRLTSIRVFEHLTADGSYLEESTFRSYIEALKDVPHSSWRAVRSRAQLSDRMLLMSAPSREGTDRIPKQGNLFLTENHIYFHSSMGGSRTIRISTITTIRKKKIGILDLDRAVEISVDESVTHGSPLNTVTIGSASPTAYETSFSEGPNTRTYTFNFSPQDSSRDFLIYFLNELITAKKAASLLSSARSISNISPALLLACNNINRVRALYRATRKFCQGLLLFSSSPQSRDQVIDVLNTNAEVPLPLFVIDAELFPASPKVKGVVGLANGPMPSLTPVPSCDKLAEVARSLESESSDSMPQSQQRPRVIVKTLANTIGDHLEYIRDRHKERRRATSEDVDEFEFRKMKERLGELVALTAPLVRGLLLIQGVLNWSDPPVTCLMFLLCICVFLYDLTAYIPTLLCFLHAGYLIYNYCKVYLLRQPLITEQAEYARMQSQPVTRFRRPVKALLAKINVVETKLAQFQELVGRINQSIRNIYAYGFQSFLSSISFILYECWCIWLCVGLKITI